MCKVEKETWLNLDQLEEDCQELITQVEKKAETLVRSEEDANFNLPLLSCHAFP